LDLSSPLFSTFLPNVVFASFFTLFHYPIITQRAIANMSTQAAPTGPRVQRNNRLNAQFQAFIRGERKITSPTDGQQFLLSVCAQESAQAAVERLVVRPFGLEAVAQAVRCDLGLDYVQSYVAKFLLHVSVQEVKSLTSGAFLGKILERIVDPPTFVIQFLDFYKTGKLNDESIEALAWLSLELMSSTALPVEDIKQELLETVNNGSLMKSQNQKARGYGYRLEKLARLLATTGSPNVPGGPGGRHDNDFEDFRKIAVYPTRDELLYTAMPFYRLAADITQVPMEDRARAHLDNQFRLLREDMLDELRHDIQVATGVKKRGRKTPVVLGELRLEDILLRTKFNTNARVSLIVSCKTGLESLTKLPVKQRKKFLQNQPRLLKHQSFGVFCKGQEPFAFGFLWRDEDRLAEAKPIIEIQMSHINGFQRVLEAFYSQDAINFISVDTPIFAYEPVLEQLKGIKELPLEEYLLDPSSANFQSSKPNKGMEKALSLFEKYTDAAGITLMGHPVDRAQVRSLIAALKQPLCVIQGPPGTGKSYVGALFVKLALSCGKRVLVLAYTNHALDQFLEDLVKLGIASTDMVRLGSKSTEATAAMSLDKQQFGRRSYAQRAAMEELDSEIHELMEDLNATLKAGDVSIEKLLEYLRDMEPDAHKALVFDVKTSDGFSVATGKGKGHRSDPGHLVMKWLKGQSPAPFWERMKGTSRRYWQMSRGQRLMLHSTWLTAIRDEKIANIVSLCEKFSLARASLETMYNQGKVEVLRGKKLIGCTTTAAAKYHELIEASTPDIVVVEEAGEILEAHILTALSPSVEQLVLIGDHKQLRPKINKYELTVEKGGGYNLNMSIFERLILAGFDYSVLKKQHRMHPEISAFPRMLTYPDLEDGPKTSQRQAPRGLQGRVIFVNHEHPEENFTGIGDRRDQGSSTSRYNTFEATMVLKLVKYLSQQSYKTDQMTVLTPYLAQLRLLRDLLSRDNDPVLADPDSAELLRAGLLTEAAAKVGKGKIRLSTIGE